MLYTMYVVSDWKWAHHACDTRRSKWSRVAILDRTRIPTSLVLGDKINVEHRMSLCLLILLLAMHRALPAWLTHSSGILPHTVSSQLQVQFSLQNLNSTYHTIITYRSRGYPVAPLNPYIVSMKQLQLNSVFEHKWCHCFYWSLTY